MSLPSPRTTCTSSKRWSGPSYRPTTLTSPEASPGRSNVRGPHAPNTGSSARCRTGTGASRAPSQDNLEHPSRRKPPTAALSHKCSLCPWVNAGNLQRVPSIRQPSCASWRGTHTPLHACALKLSVEAAQVVRGGGEAAAGLRDDLPVAFRPLHGDVGRRQRPADCEPGPRRGSDLISRGLR